MTPSPLRLTSKRGTGGECDLGTIQPDTITDLFFKADFLNIVQAHFLYVFLYGRIEIGGGKLQNLG